MFLNNMMATAKAQVEKAAKEKKAKSNALKGKNPFGPEHQASLDAKKDTASMQAKMNEAALQANALAALAAERAEEEEYETEVGGTTDVRPDDEVPPWDSLEHASDRDDDGEPAAGDQRDTNHPSEPEYHAPTSSTTVTTTGDGDDDDDDDDPSGWTFFFPSFLSTSQAGNDNGESGELDPIGSTGPQQAMLVTGAVIGGMTAYAFHPGGNNPPVSLTLAVTLTSLVGVAFAYATLSSIQPAYTL